MMIDAAAVFAIETIADDLTPFPDRASAESWLESEDVEDGVYRLFDRHGTELRLVVDRGRVVVTDDIIRSEPEYLTAKLRSYLHRVPRRKRTMDDETIDTSELQELIGEIDRIERWS
jgi:hypothetical protein